MSINTEPLRTDELKNKEVLSVFKIFIFLFVMAIPIVNLIMSFRWSFKKDINMNIKNLSKVFLMIYIVTFAIYVFIVIS